MDIKKEPEDINYDAEIQPEVSNVFCDTDTSNVKIKTEIENEWLKYKENFYDDGSISPRYPDDNGCRLYPEAVSCKQTTEYTTASSSNAANLKSALCISEVDKLYNEIQIDEQDVKKELQEYSELNSEVKIEPKYNNGISEDAINQIKAIEIINKTELSINGSDSIDSNDAIESSNELIEDSKLEIKELEDKSNKNTSNETVVCQNIVPAPMYGNDLAVSNDDSSKIHHCNQCLFRCKTYSNLKNHKLIHSDEKPYSCSLCDFRCKRLSDLKTHNLVHSDVKPYECDMCNFKSRTSSNLNLHRKTHSNVRPYVCSVCQFRCRTTGDLTKHVVIHSDIKPYACSQCDFTCKAMKNLSQHKITHKGVKAFVCDVCNFRCSTSGHLKSHKVTHSEIKSFHCEKCDYSCKHSSNLRAHQLIHTDEKAYFCELCEYRCKSSTYLKRHRRKVHKD